MNKESHPLDTYELKKLTDTLVQLERDVKRANAVSNISGGFALASLFDYDNHIIDVEIKVGVQSDCDNAVHTEQYKINRQTMQVID